MINWKELGQQALVGAIYGGAAALVVVKDLNLAILSAVAVGVIRGIAQAVIGFIEPKTTAATKFTKANAGWIRRKRIF